MFQDFIRQQGSVIPTMFVGLGGIGARMVDRIAERASCLPNWEMQLQDLTTFVCIDTNILDLNALKNIPAGSRIHIGAVDKRKVVENYRRSQNKQALHWIDRNYRPREGMKDGAGQIRVESRLGYHYASPLIRSRLQELVQYTLNPQNNWRQNHPPHYYVYVYCSLAGGTGSGNFLPVAYLIQSILRSQGWQPRVIGNFVLSTMLTRRIAPDLHANIHANTYAALKELEHLEKLNYQSVLLERPQGEPFVFWNDEQNDTIPHVTNGPFFHSFLFDRPSDKDIYDIEETVADASFLQLFTPVINAVAGEYDNYEQHLQALTHFPGENKNLGMGFTKNTGAFGTAALVLPAADLLEYSAMRFAAEALRRQVTFGAGGASSERERTLDAFRVNYNDPEFRNLDESARFERINDSFLQCVQSMAEFDGKAGQKEGYWYRLVEDVDRGQLKGLDKEQKEIRTETLTARVLRLLDEERKPIVDKVSIKNRPFVFTQEAFNQYQELLTKLKEDIRVSGQAVEAGKERLKATAREGAVVKNLQPKPTPMQERYLVIQLLKLCDSKLIPEASDQLEKARAKSMANVGVQERLEKELPATLAEAAAAKRYGFLRDDEGFHAVRNSAQTEHQDVARAQVRFFDADLKLGQYQSLRDYLSARARQYAILSTRMNDLVMELEAEAESLRSGIAPKEPRLALSVEVFETITQPRQRVWAEVYDRLFIRDGHDLTTFDRQALATSVAAQLEPVKDRDTGRFVEKDEFKLVADLKRSMVELGRNRLRKAIYGDQEQHGMTLESGLTLEARIMRPTRPGRTLGEEEIREYMEEKFRSVHLMASIIARTKTGEMRSLDDGVRLADKRHFALRRNALSPGFLDLFTTTLSQGHRQLAQTDIDNPHVALVHDVELPIPMYYFEAITGEIESGYRKIMSNDRRAFHLHTDYKWEHSLPDLNPRQAEIGVNWSLEILLSGILTKSVANVGNEWVWIRSAEDKEPLGTNLAAALYTLVSLHDNEILGPRLKNAIATAKDALGAETLRDHAEKFGVWIGGVLENIALRALHHEKTPEEDLELPILRALASLVEKQVGRIAGAKSSSGQDRLAATTMSSSMGF